MAISWCIVLLLIALKREKLRKPAFCDCLFSEFLAHKACLGFVGSISAVYLGLKRKLQMLSRVLCHWNFEEYECGCYDDLVVITGSRWQDF
jgi:hypothetical protein